MYTTGYRELEIRAAEEKRLKGDQAPETIDEFEALVRTSPNSSFVWIKYMAFMLQLADVEKARAIAERFVCHCCLAVVQSIRKICGYVSHAGMGSRFQSYMVLLVFRIQCHQC